MAARKALLRLSESVWADGLIEIALCERELEDPFAAATSAASEDVTWASHKVCKLVRAGLQDALFKVQARHMLPIVYSTMAVEVGT